MRIVWIKTNWKKPKEKCNNGEELEDRPSDKISIVKELEYQNGMYIGKEYTTHDKGYLTVGVQTDKNIKSVKAIGKLGYSRNLIEIEKGVWITCPQYIWNNDTNSYDLVSPPLGINQCGIIKFEAILENGSRIISDEVKIISTIMTDEEYLQMQNDLLIISEHLLDSTNTEYGMKNLKSLVDLRILEDRIKELKILIDKIENRPEEKLVQVRKKNNVDKVKKIDAKYLIEKEIYPFKTKITSKNIVKSYDIKEHRMIKGEIVDFIEICQRQLNYENSKLIMLNSKKLDLDKMNDLLEINNEKDIIQNVQAKKNHLNKHIDKLVQRNNCWKKIINDLEDILAIDILKNIECEFLEETHIFNFNDLYQETYDILLDIKKSLRKDEKLGTFQNDLIKSPNLYERWVFFQVIDYLIYTLKFYPSKENLIRYVTDYYEEHTTLRGLSINLENKQGKKIVITSERKIKSNSTMYPDICIDFIDNKFKRTFILDAKYKKYSINEKSRKILTDDINQSATRYKKSISNSIGAFLVHPDDELDINYNYKDSERNIHEYGYFLLKPGVTNCLDIIFRMIIHFHLQWDHLCPDCGNENTQEKKFTYSNDNSRSYKTHYICKKCNAFWVQSMCWNNKNHKIKTTRSKIYKYMIKSNFHNESQLKWDVYCPVCNKSYYDRRNY